jgi:hypothetical protein
MPNGNIEFPGLHGRRQQQAAVLLKLTRALPNAYRIQSAYGQRAKGWDTLRATNQGLPARRLSGLLCPWAPKAGGLADEQQGLSRDSSLGPLVGSENRGTCTRWRDPHRVLQSAE